MAKIRVRPETGLLQFDFHYRGVRCREQTSHPDTPENRAVLERQLAMIVAEMADGTFQYQRHFPGSRLGQRFAMESASLLALPAPQSQPLVLKTVTPSFSHFAGTWMAELAPTWRVATRELHRTLLDRYLLPAFSDRPLSSITRADLLQFRAELITTPRGKRDKPLAPASVNHVLKLLRAILAEAASRYDFQDPSARLKRVKVPRSDVEPFTLDEVSTILGACRTDYRNYFTIRFFTGMRSGEIHGLKWSRVDFERRQILVRETYAHGRTEYTKTDGSQRAIEMSSMVLEALQRQREATGDGEYVFCNLNRQPLDEGNVTKRVWYPLLSLLDLKKRRPYQTRHTCATLWLSAGEAPEWIARQLGHSTTEMLFRVYSRFVPNLTRRDGAAFEALIARAATSASAAAAATTQEPL